MEKSVCLLSEDFAQRLEDDYFNDLDAGGHPVSIRDFIHFLTAGNVSMRRLGLSGHARFPDLTDLSITFKELLQRPLNLNGRDLTIRTLYSDFVCRPLTFALIQKNAAILSQERASHAALIEMGARNWQEWATEMATPERLIHVAQVLADLAADTLANRTLISFFIQSPAEGKFLSWGPRAASGIGRKLPVKVSEGDGYTVTTTVSRYEEVECAVTAYEWQATLTVAGAAEPDAAACGMLYVFDRADGVLIGGLDDLIIASDSMADEDVLQAKAFITQHDDAEQVIEKSDLCFVWLWERRGGARKGLGAKCLVAGYNDIQRRFKKIRTLVLNAHPAQFIDQGSRVQPPMVAVERQTAIENLVAYVHSIDLKTNVRPIFTTLDNPEHDALSAIGDVIKSQFGEDMQPGLNRADQDDSGLDVAAWAEELAELFRMAGLDDLADGLEGGIAPYEEVETALKNLIFEPSVQYMRVSSSGSFERMFLGIDVVPHQIAHESIAGVDEFCEHLPEGMRLISVDKVHDYVVCTVAAETPFGNLVEYFTLVRKPRPINIDSFFRRL